MQLKRATEIANSKDNNIIVYYKENPVTIESIDNEIGTAYVTRLHGNIGFEVNVEQLTELIETEK